MALSDKKLYRALGERRACRLQGGALPAGRMERVRGPDENLGRNRLSMVLIFRNEVRYAYH